MKVIIFIVIVVILILGGWRYSFLFSSRPSAKTLELNRIVDFTFIDGLRGWYWGGHSQKKNNTPDSWYYSEKFGLWRHSFFNKDKSE